MGRPLGPGGRLRFGRENDHAAKIRRVATPPMQVDSFVESKGTAKMGNGELVVMALLVEEWACTSAVLRFIFP